MDGGKSRFLRPVVGISLFALILILLVTVFSDKSHRGSRGSFLAQVENLEGKAEIRRNRESQWSPASQGETLNHFDRIRISTGSTATLSFRKGLLLQASPLADVIVEEQETPQREKVVFINIISGNVKVLKAVKPGSFLLSYGRQLVDPAGRVIDNNAAPSHPTSTVEKFMQPMKTPSAAQTLTDDEISHSVSSQSSLLNRCYVNFLKSQHSVKGQIQLSFSITPSGAVEAVRILQSDFQDQKFGQCIQEVFSRAKFRRFDGEPIVVNYPVAFQ